ncbi:MAG: L,D-transpeptidase family protein [Kovacikia sp.]
METRLVRKLLKVIWLSSGLLLLSVGTGSFISPGLRHAVAQPPSEVPKSLSEEDYSVPPPNSQARGDSRPEVQNTGAPIITSPDRPIEVNPTFYSATLPPLGEASAYLPGRVEDWGIHLIVKLRDRKVYVYNGRKTIVSYPIAVGKPGWETPVGTYQVFSKEVNPIFKSFKTGNIIRPGPDNPLGIRWIGIWTDGKTQLGFHGTNQPELIGGAVSHGCIRMRNKDVLALFEQVSVGTPVTVEP